MWRPCPEPDLAGQGTWSHAYLLNSPDGVLPAIETVVSDVISILLEQANIEMAKSDATKTLAAAWMDIITTTVASIAVAAGCSEIVTLFSTVLCRLTRTTPQNVRRHQVCKCVGKLLAVVVVVGTLVLPPLLILLTEDAAHDSNAKGDTSQVGWVAQSTSVGLGPYVVLGLSL